MDFLINLDSPVVGDKSKTNYTSRNPLLPCTNIQGNIELQNNPFDAVVDAIELNQRTNDPFDIVFEASVKTSNENNDNLASVVNDAKENTPEDLKTFSTDSIKNDIDMNKIKNNIKEYVAERIDSFIRRSITSTNSPLVKSNKQSQKYFRRSFSAGIILPLSGNNSKELTHCYLNSSLPLRTSTVSLDAQNHSSIGDHSNFEMTKRNLREEANKISQLINDSLLNTSILEESDDIMTNESSEDLLEVQPPWESNEVVISDEEDSVGLPKLKTFRHSFTGISNIKPLIPDIKTIEKYIKKRIDDKEIQSKEEVEDADTSQLSECFKPDIIAASSSFIEDVEQETKCVHSVEESKEIAQQCKIDICLVNNNLPLRPKKKLTNEVIKKGPMRAVVPLQKMSKNLTSKLASPFKSKINRVNSSKKDDKNKEVPLATSTPTRSSNDSVIKSSLRSRDNNKMSPTGRKAAKRSSSVGTIERKTNNKLPDTPVKIKDSPIGLKRNKDNLLVLRPHSAPNDCKADKNISTFGGKALKALTSRPNNKNSLKLDIEKNPSKLKHPVPPSSMDKENRVTTRKKSTVS